MKIMQKIKLGHKNISMHKICTVIIIFSLSLTFSYFIGRFLSVEKEKNDLISKNLSPTDGKVLISSNFCRGIYKAIDSECENPESYDLKAQELAKKYRGEQVGAKITYKKNNSDEKMAVIAERAAKYLVSKPLYFAPDNTIPVVVGEDVAESPEYFVIGNIVKTNTFYLVMDSSPTIMNYLSANDYSVIKYEPVIAFENLNDAYIYYEKENSDSNVISELFADTIEVKNNYNNIYNDLLKTFIITVSIIFAIVLILSIIIIKANKKVTALYRSLGATKRDVFLIYLFGIIEILLIITIIAIPVGKVYAYVL